MPLLQVSSSDSTAAGTAPCLRAPAADVTAEEESLPVGGSDEDDWSGVASDRASSGEPVLNERHERDEDELRVVDVCVVRSICWPSTAEKAERERQRRSEIR